jgi:hypothetical protein
MSEPGAVTIGPYRSGEIPAPLVVTFRDSANLAIDLTAYTAKWITQRHAVTGWPDFTAADPAAVTSSATVLNQSTNKGQVQYTWVAADFTTPGYYEGEMWAGNGANRFASIRFMWIVNAAIAVPSI